MKKLSILPLVLGALLVASAASAQTLELSFDEGSILPCVDGRTALVPNPEWYDFPSADIWVIATEISQVFGYEYNLTSTDGTAVARAPVIYPSVGSDFATLPGDVRVGTGICFQAGSSEAGPNPSQIRLARHQFTWFAPPTSDIFYCVQPSQASVTLTGATAPQYTECISNPISRPFAVGGSNSYYVPEGCVVLVFEFTQFDPYLWQCYVVDAQKKSWGSLKAAY